MSIKKELFGRLTTTTEEVFQYTLTNTAGTSVIFTDFGLTVLKVLTADKHGTIENITICYETLEDLQNPPLRPYFGAIIGRFANRIAQGELTIDNNHYSLATNNNGIHHLHGGLEGFDKKLWKCVSQSCDEIGVSMEFEYFSKDGEENYPGNLTARVKYELNNENQFVITFQATTDKKTIVNMTNHTYWNLSGSAKEKIYHHQLQMGCSTYLPVNETLIPTGEIRSVKGTPFDFTPSSFPFPHEMKHQMLQINGGGKPGIDHCFIIDGALDTKGHYHHDPSNLQGSLRFASKVHDPHSGRSITVHTTQPGIQIYTSNFLPDDESKHPFTFHNAFCLETQHLPDSPHHSHFPSVLLAPGEVYCHQSVYTFSVN